MELNYLVLLEYSTERIIVIKLTDEQRYKADEYEDLEEYIETLEDEYGFSLSDCNWISLENFEIERHGFNNNTLKIGD